MYSGIDQIGMARSFPEMTNAMNKRSGMSHGTLWSSIFGMKNLSSVLTIHSQTGQVLKRRLILSQHQVPKRSIMFILRTTIDGDPGIGIKIITIPCSCA
jgi:hypothetical protein